MLFIILAILPILFGINKPIFQAVRSSK